MTSKERLEALQKWVFEHACAGKSMKTRGRDDMTALYKEPQCYIAYYPKRSATGTPSYSSVAPSILIEVGASKTRQVQEQRLDRYSNIHRSPDMGATLSVGFVFVVYDPGTRNQIAEESGMASDIETPGDAGFYTLTTWMDELQRELLGARVIPGTDLFLLDESGEWQPVTVQDSDKDTRPGYYYGIFGCEFGCYANHSDNPEIRRLLYD